MKNKYAMLKQAVILMVLDTGGKIVETVLTLIFSSPAISSLTAVSYANVYVSWTLWGLYLLLWLLTITLLSHMTVLRVSFGKARIWYLLRILAFIVFMMATTATAYLSYRSRPDPAPETTLLIGQILIFNFGLNFLADALLLSMGNRAILNAGAELLESFGLNQPAEANRRCGNRLIRFTAAYACLLIFACVILLGLSFMNELPFFGMMDAEGVRKVLVCLDIAAFLLCLPMWLGMVIFRILAPVHMNRAYHAIRELIE